jgi:hypothetical protein
LKLNRLISIALAGLALALVSSLLVAQTSESHDTQDNNFKIKMKDDRVIVRDKSKPVRRALEEMYAKIAEAQRNEDIEAMRATRTPDFTVDLPNGQKWDLDTAMNYSRAGFQQVESNIHISNTIESLDVSEVSPCALPDGRATAPLGRATAPDDRSPAPNDRSTAPCYQAVAVVHQRWSRMQMKEGKLRRVDTEAIQTETWVRTKDGWRLRHIGNVNSGAWYIDGKRVDPSKPYDPNAPEYKPD